MKVTFNVENDAELRAAVKDLIKGQVLSIVREEFVEIIKEELERKLKGTERYVFETYLRDSMKSAITSILQKEHKVGNWNSDYITPIVSQIVNKSIEGKNWDLMVDQLAKEKVRSLLS